MNRHHWIAVVLVVGFLLGVGIVRGQAQTDDRPLVVIIEGRRPLDSAAMTNIGPAGISQLAAIFRAQGARVQFARLDAPLSTDTDVVVLVRPVRSLKLPQVGYLWAHLARGGNLLLAIDPEGTFLGNKNVKPRYNRSGLSALIEQDFGITVGDTFLAEPWYTIDTIQNLDTTYSLAFADVVAEPITAPLRRYALPVWVWGARHMVVEPLGPGSVAAPLLYTESAFGETGKAIFRTRNDDAAGQLAYEAPLDVTGRLNLGAQAIRTDSGARIVLLGDSEMLQNGYGLVRDELTSRYPGNRILAERIAGWLLETPPETWPALPRDWTWLAVDGRSDDWADRQASVVWDDADPAPVEPDIQAASAFADDLYVYVLVRTLSAPEAADRLSLVLDVNRDGRPDRQIVVTADEVTLYDEAGRATPVVDAGIARADVLELRLPRRLFGSDLAFRDVCLATGRAADAAQAADCLDKVLRASLTTTRSPFDAMLVNHLLVTVYTSGGVYMRGGPATRFPVLTTLGNGTTLAAIGRSADGDWIQVQNARYTGWIAEFLLTPNGSLSQLPVIVLSSE